MVTKLKYYLKLAWYYIVTFFKGAMRIFISLLPVIIILAALITPIFFFSAQITAFEIRYYIAVFLFCCIAMCFGVLRVYNAVVMNTRYTMILINKMKGLASEIHKLAMNVSQNIKELKEFKSIFSKFKK